MIERVDDFLEPDLDVDKLGEKDLYTLAAMWHLNPDVTKKEVADAITGIEYEKSDAHYRMNKLEEIGFARRYEGDHHNQPDEFRLLNRATEAAEAAARMVPPGEGLDINLRWVRQVMRIELRHRTLDFQIKAHIEAEARAAAREQMEREEEMFDDEWG